MTHTRPTDEVTGKVVAKKEGWGDDSVRYSNLNGEGCFYTVNTRSGEVDDPRDSDQATMELLWSLELNLMWMYPCNALPDGGWAIHNNMIPISGPAFRYAVVHLAAKILEVE